MQIIEGLPYQIAAFGELVIPKDWVFYTELPARLAYARNEEALADLLHIITRIRRSRGMKYHAILGDKMMPNLAGVERRVAGPGMRQ